MSSCGSWKTLHLSGWRLPVGEVKAAELNIMGSKVPPPKATPPQYIRPYKGTINHCYILNQPLQNLKERNQVFCFYLLFSTTIFPRYISTGGLNLAKVRGLNSRFRCLRWWAARCDLGDGVISMIWVKILRMNG